MLASLLNFRRHIEDLRDKSRTSPYAFMWITLALSTLAIPMGYFSSYAPNAQHLSVWVLMVIAWVASLAGILYVGGMASWGLRRQTQKKSWGVPLPDEENTWLFRPGVWAGLAVGMLYQAVLLVLGAVLWFLLHIKLGLNIAGVSGAVGTVYTLTALTALYKIPKGFYLGRFVFAPLIILSALGIALAIILGQIRNYDQAAKKHAEQSPARRQAVAPATAIRPPAPTGRFSETFSPDAPVLQEPHIPQTMPPRSLATVDQHCIGGLPMALPQHPAGLHSGTVTAFVPRRMAISTIFRTQRAVHGFLSPEYMADQRVLVHPDGANPAMRLMAVVPAGMTVQIGQEADVAGAHASHRFACRYTPDLLMAPVGTTPSAPSTDGGLTAQYTAEIMRKIYATWPVHFTQKLRCRLLISLNPDGTLRSSPMIEQPSGSDSFDNAAVEAVKKAAPFPLPTGLPSDKFSEVVLTLRSVS